VRKHEDAWVLFVEEAIECTDGSQLKEAPGFSKAEFAAKIRNLD
jgi:hypothetical protein